MNDVARVLARGAMALLGLGAFGTTIAVSAAFALGCEPIDFDAVRPRR